VAVITENNVPTKQSRDTTASVGNVAAALATPLALSKLSLKKSVTLLAPIFGTTVISRVLSVQKRIDMSATGGYRGQRQEI
jgi:hypothetical protein